MSLGEVTMLVLQEIVTFNLKILLPTGNSYLRDTHLHYVLFSRVLFSKKWSVSFTWIQNRNGFDSRLRDLIWILLIINCIVWWWSFNISAIIFTSKLVRKRINRDSYNFVWNTRRIPSSWQKRSWKDWSLLISHNNRIRRRIVSSSMVIRSWRSCSRNSLEKFNVRNSWIRLFLVIRNCVAIWLKTFIELMKVLLTAIRRRRRSRRGEKKNREWTKNVTQKRLKEKKM